MFEVIGLIVGLLVLAGLIVLLLYYAAKNKQQASFVKQSTIEFVVAGETLINVLENINEWHYRAHHEGPGWFPIQRAERNPDGTVKKNPDGTFKLIDDAVEVHNAVVPNGIVKEENGTKHNNGPGKSSRLQRRFGFFWVSALYPLRRIFSFPIAHLRLKSETAISKDDPLEKWLDSSVKKNGEVIPGDTTDEQSLLWKFPRPILVRDVEFADLFRANILILAYFQIVRPRPLVFEYREKFFLLLEKAIQAEVIDYLRKIHGGYREFITGGQTGPLSTFFWEALEGLNWVGQTSESRRGLVREFGVYLRDASVVQIELSDKDEKAQMALEANEIARLEGEATKTAAKARAEAITTIANAEAGALQAQLAGSSEAILIEKLRKEAVIGNLTATTLIERGAVQVKL